MEKRIELNENTEITVTNNIRWMRIYKNQFGHDIVPTLIPVVNAAMEIAFEAYKATGGKAVDKDIINDIDVETIQYALVKAAGLELVDVINVVWAMTRAADKNIPDPETWSDSLETFPLDIIVPEIGMMIVKSLVSEKNFSRLQTVINELKPGKKTKKSN